MGLRGPRGVRPWLIPGSDDYLDMILGPYDDSRMKQVLRNWKRGGRELVMSKWKKKDELPYAYWRVDVPLKIRRRAFKYRTDAQAIKALGIEVPIANKNENS